MIDEKLTGVHAEVARRNPGEIEFLQAVRDVLVSIGPVLAKHPELADHKTIERICEPERQIIFRVPWQDDRGEIQINRGFRVEFNSALGPYKGGLRFHPSVNSRDREVPRIRADFKNALTGMPIGGGKGGADFDPKGRSDDEVMRFCQSFMTELYRHLGEYTDVPAGDIGVGPREIGYLFGQYKRITNRYESGVLTGKGTDWGGALVRSEATGYGVVYFAERMLAARGDELDGKTCVVSGAGQRRHLRDREDPAARWQGRRVLGLDGLRRRPGRHRPRHCSRASSQSSAGASPAMRSARPRPRSSTGGTIWDVPCDLAFPCATQNELTGRDARRLSRTAAPRWSRGPTCLTTPDAVRSSARPTWRSAPARPPTPEALRPRRSRCSRTPAATRGPSTTPNAPRADHCRHPRHCRETAGEYAAPGNYVVGANIAGFLRVSRAMVALGLI